MKSSSKISLAAGIVVWFGLAAGYWFRPEPFKLLTTYPTWIWPVLGALAGLVVALGNRRAALVILGMSTLFFLAVCEEPFSLARGLTRPESGIGKQGHIRVMSINCAGGNLMAGEEATAFSPDIVLLQESPSKGRHCKAMQEALRQQWHLCLGL